MGEIKGNIEEESCNEERIGDILRLCPTRLTVRRAKCYKAHTGESRVTFQIMGGLSREENRCHVKARIVGCDAQMMTFDFFFGLHLTWQTTSPELYNFQVIKLRQVRIFPISSLYKHTNIQTLETITSETSFNSFFL